MKRGLANKFLGLNSIFSALTGLCALFLASPLAKILFLSPGGWGVWTLRGLGIGLLLFSIRLFVLARNSDISKPDVMRIVIADGIWILISVVLVVGFGNIFTDTGVKITISIAIIIGILAMGQFVGARRI